MRISTSADRWVGTGHYSIEPGLLYSGKLSDRWTLQAELRDWISIGGADDYAGNVLRYGVGVGYDWIKGSRYRITPVVEAVGWTVLDGQVFDFDDDNMLKFWMKDASPDPVMDIDNFGLEGFKGEYHKANNLYFQ